MGDNSSAGKRRQSFVKDSKRITLNRSFSVKLKSSCKLLVLIEIGFMPIQCFSKVVARKSMDTFSLFSILWYDNNIQKKLKTFQVERMEFALYHDRTIFV